MRRVDEGDGIISQGKKKERERDSFIHTEMAHQVFPHERPELTIC